MTLHDLEDIITAGRPLTLADAARLLATMDLPSLGMLGEAVRKARTGEVVTFGRVAVFDPGTAPPAIGQAGEVRLGGRPDTIAQAREQVRAAVSLAGGVPVTGYSLADLVALAGGSHAPLVEMARALAADGLTAVAEAPVDAFPDATALIAAVEAVRRGGLGAWRVTVHRAPSMEARLERIDRVARLQLAAGDVRAFAPLPRVDPSDEPSTGFDDVRTVAAARLMLDGSVIQVDWPLYGPKLAQVAVTFGAGDIDGVAAVDDAALGPRRAARADIERQIRAASGTPVERNGRYERLP
jgi:aminodeoxyfutalosine synthase